MCPYLAVVNVLSMPMLALREEHIRWRDVWPVRPPACLGQEPLTYTDIIMPYVFLGHEAFQPITNLVKPFPISNSGSKTEYLITSCQGQSPPQRTCLELWPTGLFSFTNIALTNNKVTGITLIFTLKRKSPKISERRLSFSSWWPKWNGFKITVFRSNHSICMTNSKQMAPLCLMYSYPQDDIALPLLHN